MPYYVRMLLVHLLKQQDFAFLSCVVVYEMTLSGTRFYSVGWWEDWKGTGVRKSTKTSARISGEGPRRNWNTFGV
jgi:hypothetical protein